MPDVDPIKAEIRIELTKDDTPEAQRRLEALKEAAGSAGSGLGDLGTSVSELGSQLEQGTPSIGGFNDALAALKSPAEEGQKAIAQFSDSLATNEDTIDTTRAAYEALAGPLGNVGGLIDTASPKMLEMAKNTGTVVEALSQSIPMLPQFAASMHEVSDSFDPAAYGLNDFTENMAVFQDALVNPEPFLMIGQHLTETGQNWQDFTSSIGEDNSAILETMATTGNATHQVLSGMSADVQATQKAMDEFNQTDPWSTLTNEQANSAINDISSAGTASVAPGEEFVTPPGLADFHENLLVFQDALENPAPFEMIQQHLTETAQTWQDFTSSIGEDNTAMLQQMSQNNVPLNEMLNDLGYGGSGVQDESKPFDVSAGTDQFNGMATAGARANDAISEGFDKSGASAAQAYQEYKQASDQIWASGTAANNAFAETNSTLGDTSASLNEVGKAGDTLEGPLEYFQSMEQTGFGEAFSNASEGLMGAMNQIAMPLMAVQMIGMAVQAVGQSIYDAAAIAEGPAAHSFGTFTGTVDALGQSAAQTGQQFSEGFGQGVLPALNEMNYEMTQGQQSAGPFGQSLGLATATLASLWQIGSGADVIGGVEGLVNVGAQVMGAQQPFQGPGPAQQSQIAYKQAIANMPTTLDQQVTQANIQTATNLADAITPANLQSQDNLAASQVIYQRMQANYNSRHPVNQYDLLQQAQETAYDQQQATNYQQQMANPTYSPYDPLGYWGGVLGPVGGAISGFFGNRGPSQSTTDLAGPPQTPFDSFFGGIGQVGSNMWSAGASNLGSLGNFLGGGGTLGKFFGDMGGDIGGIGTSIGGFLGGIGNFLSGGGTPISSTGGGCFLAGTRVLMANGSERAIETLQIGERVLAHDGTKQIHATITDCITFAAKQTYKLVFSNGTTLFTTDSHPISTTQGWKSISPESTAAENPGLPVTPLAIGDDIYTADAVTCRLISLEKHEVATVYNITVDTAHTYYACKILVHNAKGLSDSGVGSENVSLSHTFTASVTWAANNLEKSFTAAAQWAEQGLVHAATAVANWAEQGLVHAATAVAQWAEQGLVHAATAVAQWAEQGLMHEATAVAQWAEQGLMHEATAVAQWAEQDLIHPVVATAQWAAQGLEQKFTGVASWVGQELSHTFTGIANWVAQNLTPTFTVTPQVTMLAEGASNFAGGAALVAEAGYPEVVEHNGQYSLFNQATLLDLPQGANVYPMKNLSSSSVAQFADGTGDGTIIPLTFGVNPGGGGSSMPSSMNIYLNIDGQTFWSATGLSLAQNVRAGLGMRSY